MQNLKDSSVKIKIGEYVRYQMQLLSNKNKLSNEDIEKAWKYAVEGSRGDIVEVIVEAFVNFHSEITLLTVTQNNNLLSLIK